MSRAGRHRSHVRAFASAAQPAVSSLRLSNGVELVACPRPQLSQAYVSLFFRVGSRYETLENNGLTHMLEHMLFRGTETYRDATRLNAAAEDFGGFLEGGTYRDHMMLATGCHPAAVPQAISILSEIVQTPRFRSLEVERAILREELLETLDADGRMVDLDNIAHHGVYGRRGLGLPIEGSSENLERFTRADLEAHRKRFLHGGGTVLSVAGNIDGARILALGASKFAGLSSGPAPRETSGAAPRDEPVLRYVRDPSSQVDLRVSFRGCSLGSPHYPALVMLGRILADGLASRMHAELVDRRGLAYALHAGLTTYSDGSLFDFDISVAPGRAAEALRAILDFASASKRFRFTEEELARACRRYRYGLDFMEDSAAELASYHGRAKLFAIEDELETLSALLEAVDGAAVRSAAKQTFVRPGMVVSAVGELARGQHSELRSVMKNWG